MWPSKITARAAYYPVKPSFNDLNVNEMVQNYGSFDFVDDPNGGPRDIIISNPTPSYVIQSFVIPQLTNIPNSTGNPPPGGRVRCHQLAGPRFQALFQAWEDAGLMDRINDFSGPYNPRYIGGVVHDGNMSRLSKHSWGTAIDLNVDQNQRGVAPARLGEHGTILELVPIANALGFFWGGHYSRKLDGMHFEIAIP